MGMKLAKSKFLLYGNFPVPQSPVYIDVENRHSSLFQNREVMQNQLPLASVVALLKINYCGTIILPVVLIILS